MRTLGITVLTLGLAAAITAPARAQGFFSRRGMGMGGYTLLTNKSVQQELKLDESQIEKSTKLVEEVSARMREKTQDIPDDLRAEKIPKIARAANDEIKAALKDVIKPAQFARLDQIARQAQGVQAFGDATVQETLQLTDDQKAKIKEISDDSQRQTREIFLRGRDDRQAMMEKLATLRKEAVAKAVATLSADQQKTWKSLTGDPFEVKYELRPRNT